MKNKLSLRGRFLTFTASASLLLTLSITPPYIKAAANAVRGVYQSEETAAEIPAPKKAAPFVLPEFSCSQTSTDISREIAAILPPAYPQVPSDIQFQPPEFYKEKSASTEISLFDSARDKNGPLLQGKLAGKGGAIIRIARQYAINPALLGAICAWETGRGKSEYAMKYNNVSGSLHCVGGKWIPRRFASVEECLEYTAKNLSKNYIGMGLNTVEKIQQKYCPVITDRSNPNFNDPKGVNGHWLNGVKGFRALFMEALQKSELDKGQNTLIVTNN